MDRRAWVLLFEDKQRCKRDKNHCVIVLFWMSSGGWARRLSANIREGGREHSAAQYPSARCSIVVNQRAQIVCASSSSLSVDSDFSTKDACSKVRALVPVRISKAHDCLSHTPRVWSLDTARAVPALKCRIFWMKLRCCIVGQHRSPESLLESRGLCRTLRFMSKTF